MKQIKWEQYITLTTLDLWRKLDVIGCFTTKDLIPISLKKYNTDFNNKFESIIEK